MATSSSPSIPTALERMNWRASSTSYECSVLSCAWKAPRVLTGALASCSSSHHYDGGGRWRRSSWLRGGGGGNPVVTWRDEDITKRKFGHSSAISFVISEKFIRSYSSLEDKAWQLSCSSSSSGSFGGMSAASLWEDLRPAISYLAPEELHLVQDALEVAFEAHYGQIRRSGEPFITHPVEVARILGEYELDWESIAAGLLHDTVEDTDVVTFESIEKKFGATVRRIVEGETKVSKLGKLRCKDGSNSKQDVKADDLMKMFLAMTEEVRVIIVKIADRLHNMRTLSHMPPHKQAAIAKETLQIFAPLAKHIGMYGIKSELEYLSFMYTNPGEFIELRNRVEDLYKAQEKELEEASRILRQKIAEDQFLDHCIENTEMRFVCKELYSIHKVMVKYNMSINEVNKVAQLQMIVKPRACNNIGPLCNAHLICYHLLGLVHGIWTPAPLTVKDYIATPKPNGYQSLHSTVIPFLNGRTFHLEVQIRTEDMDLIAERGFAAHYSGRVVSRADMNNPGFALRIGWLNAIREWQKEFIDNMTSTEFVHTIIGDLLGSRVFVFTPKGEIKNLPKGATVVDYAYLIHSEIGNKMVKAKVNGNLVLPIHQLANADVVEIITDDALPSKSAYEMHQQWANHAKTRSARHKIMKFLREQAAKSANEITADTVNNFVADLEYESASEQSFPKMPNEDGISIWGKRQSMEKLPINMKYDDLVHLHKFVSAPKVNGKASKSFEKKGIKINGTPVIQGDSYDEFIRPSIPTHKEVLPSLETWISDTVAAWHDVEGKSVQWFCIICIDRKGMMAQVTSALTAHGFVIFSCVAQTNRTRGIAVMLFQFEASYNSMVDACLSINGIAGVLGSSVGCSWTSYLNDDGFLEC